MTLIFATHNRHKASEIKNILPGNYQLKTLDDMGLAEEIPETGTTLQQNALIKARYIFNKTGKSCFADDTGLEVTALNGAPGVYSARYAGESTNAASNIEKLLVKMQGEKDREARFRTVIALIDKNGNEHLFEGIVEGTITTEPRGKEGFGYDPVFVPKGSEQTFAEMSAEAKNEISHRARAMAKLIGFLRK